MRIVVLVPVLVCALASAVFAQGQPLALGRGFKPNPIVTQHLSARVDRDTRVYDRGWKQCDPGGGAFTTKEPLLTWEVTEEMTMRIRLETETGDVSGSGGVIVFPDRSYVCADGRGEAFMKSWPRGRYALHLYGNAIGVAATVRFEDPTRAQRDLAAATGKLPVVTLGADGALNPRHDEVAATVSIDAGDAGSTCARARQRVMPLARVDVARASSWYIASEDAPLFVLTADGQCLDPADAPKLAAGTYTLWTIVPRTGAAARYPLEIDDRAAPIALPTAERREVGALDAPLVIDGKVRAAERWYARDGACRGAARAPDLYLHAARPIVKASLSLLWSRAPQRVHVMGPLEEQTPSMRPQCGDDRGSGKHDFDVLEGTYAIWIGGEAAAAGTDFHLLVLRDGLAIDPLTTLAPVPAELSLAERALTNHYPYFRGGPITAWTPMWTTAPEQLFVYHRLTGEPYLVNWSQKDTTSAYRYDGSHVSVDTRLLEAARPARIALPDKPELPTVESLGRAVDLAGAEDKKAIAAHNALDQKFRSCFFAYLRKNDPTFGKDYEVLRISGGKVVNVGDAIAVAGARKCGEKKLTAAGKNLEKQLAKTRTARYAQHLAAVRKRFGL